MPINESHSYKPDPENDNKIGFMKLIGRLARFLIQAVMFVILLFFILLFIFRWAPIPTSAFIYQQNALAKQSPKIYLKASYEWQDWDGIPLHVALAVVAAEDQRFPQHWGIDVVELKKAFAQRGKKKRPRGASTITQQTAKNLFLWNGRSYIRKVIEAAMSVAIEVTWPKQRILEVYLNIAQFGDATYGIKAASYELFDKTPRELSLEEAAMLAAVLPKPAASNINNPSSGLLKRQKWILKQMKQLGGNAYLLKLK
ncbi:MAG: monofunctional biosynthetic peptidoglycan transglycosylase [Cocleimonas sp.]